MTLTIIMRKIMQMQQSRGRRGPCGCEQSYWASTQRGAALAAPPRLPPRTQGVAEVQNNCITIGEIPFLACPAQPEPSSFPSVAGSSRFLSTPPGLPSFP